MLPFERRLIYKSLDAFIFSVFFSGRNISSCLEKSWTKDLVDQGPCKVLNRVPRQEEYNA